MSIKEVNSNIMDINEKIAQVERELQDTQNTIKQLNDRSQQLLQQLIRLDERRKVYLEEKQEAEKAAKEV